jgi:16S rRNA (guanine527-N7)-methyltransferase
MSLTPDQHATFELYARRLLEENRRTNLTSTRDREALYRRHFAESLAILRALEDHGVELSPMIDVGAGAGFPGLPIKIARPELDVTLLEATGKKTRFLEAMVEELGLSGVRVVQGRAEDVGREPPHREAYRLVLARAVAPLPVLLELTLPFLSIGGVVAAPKGSALEREVGASANALGTLGGEIEATVPLDLPGEGPRQTLVIVRKTGGTPAQYPRRAGMPAKRPL